MTSIIRRLIARFSKPQAEAPGPDPDDAPLSFEQTRSVRYWSERDRRFRKDRPESDPTPRGWRI